MCKGEREEKANFQADMKSTLHALKVSGEAATALRESESSLTDAVVSYAEEIKDLRAQLSAMRTDRDQGRQLRRSLACRTASFACASPPPRARRAARAKWSTSKVRSPS